MHRNVVAEMSLDRSGQTEESFSDIYQVIPAECLRIRIITFCFNESRCKSVDEIDQNTPALSVSQFKETGLKRNVSARVSSLQKQKWDDD